MTLNPRPDQQAKPGHGSAAGGVSLGQMNLGVPPGVGQITSAVQLFADPNSSPFTLNPPGTFPRAGRLWVASLSGTFAAQNNYPIGINKMYAELKTGSGIVLSIIEMVVTAANTFDSKQSDVQWNGLPVASGETLVLDVNNGTAIGSTVIRVSGVVSYSIP